MEIPSLFIEKAIEEEKTMRDLLDNLKERMLYLEKRYLALEDEYSKPKQTVEDLEVNRNLEDHELSEFDLKEDEDAYSTNRIYLMRDLGLLSPEQLKELEEKEHPEKK